MARIFDLQKNTNSHFRFFHFSLKNPHHAKQNLTILFFAPIDYTALKMSKLDELAVK